VRGEPGGAQREARRAYPTNPALRAWLFAGATGSYTGSARWRRLLEDGEALLRQLDDAIWVVDHPDFTMPGGIAIGTRTTLVRLSDGGVFMHSPGPLSVSLAEQIEEIGPVRFIVAPNAYHHLFVAENAKAWQSAEIHLAPGLAAKQQLSFTAELGDEPPPAWSADLDQCLVAGAPRLNEVAFLHRPSRTLILTDLAFNVARPASLRTRLFFRLTGVHGGFSTSRLMRLLVRDRAAARSSAERVLGWEFDRIIVSHGDVLEDDAQRSLQRALAWLTDA